ncbi:MAG TPA: GNAT family protein [Candidatus Acidoferrales bacterium]|nr:GNAT family protein [Candidatus Acidoferrales bacterium]
MDNFNSLILEGRRVTLRSVRLEDANELFRIITESREHLERWLPWVDYIRSVDDESHIVEQWTYEMQMKTAIHFCINAESQTAGLVSTHQIDWMNQRTSIGYWIKAGMANKGIITESTAVVMEYVFEKLNLHRIYIQAATGNAPSNRVIQKLGFKHEGVLRENERLREHYLDHNIYGMTKGDFSKIKPSLSKYFK